MVYRVLTYACFAFVINFAKSREQGKPEIISAGLSLKTVSVLVPVQSLTQYNIWYNSVSYKCMHTSIIYFIALVQDQHDIEINSLGLIAQTDRLWIGGYMTKNENFWSLIERIKQANGIKGILGI